ncbi:MAG: Arc family DNA-binding protein [Bacteroidales bacterium]|jgi:hypothetical protein|nr:Arc family DNA-binding protein [Bacteroidales bacterium]
MKKNFALRVDSEIFEAVEKWAADEFRSTNGQIEWILSTALKKSGRLPTKKAEPKADNDKNCNFAD